MPSQDILLLQDNASCSSGSNNQGVGYFVNGDYAKAFCCFRQGLIQIKTSQQEQAQDSHDQGHADLFKSQLFPLCPTELGMTYKSSSDASFSGSSADSFILHSQCFPLSDTRGRISSDPMEEATVQSAVLIFNSALLYHMQGLKNSSLRHLTKAMQLYQQACTLLQDYICSNTSSAGIGLVDLLSLAVLNNLGLLHREFSPPNVPQEIFRQLARYVSQVQTTEKTLMMRIDEFMLNAAILLGFHGIASAAAA